MEKILIVGGAGYFGSHISRELIRSGYQVIVMDNLSTGNKKNIPTAATFYKGNACKLKNVMNVFFKEPDINLVIYLASNENKNNTLDNYNINLEGVRVVVDVMNEFGVKNIIYSSTGLMYEKKDDKNKETDPIKPYDSYTQSKKAGEDFLYWVNKSYGFKTLILRTNNVYGFGDIEYKTPQLEDVNLIYKVNMSKLNENFLVRVNSDYVDEKIDYLHIEDLAQAFAKASNYILSNKQVLETFNVSSNNIYTFKQLKEEFFKNGEIQFDIIEDEEDEVFLPPVLDNEKAIRLLEYNPIRTFKNVISSDFTYRQRFFRPKK